MKKLIKINLIIVLLMSLSSSCAFSAKLSPPKLGKKTLYLDPDKPGFYYEYCSKKWTWKECSKTKHWVREEYDLKVPGVRQKLIYLGYKLRF